MHNAASTAATLIRCTTAMTLTWIAAAIWRTATHVAPKDHPARAFAEGAAEQAKPVQRALGFTPSGTRVAVVVVWAWTGAVLGWGALLGSEFAAVTNVLWDGALPG